MELGMTKQEQLLALFRKRGVLTVDDRECNDIPHIYFSRLCAAGLIDRIGHGVYSCPGYSSTEYITNVEAAAVIPQGVVCLFSALRHHGLTLENPHRLHIAIPRGARVPKHELPVEIYRFSMQAHAFGVETVQTKDGAFKVYSVEKTIVDCFKFRNAVGLDVAIAALKDAQKGNLIDHDRIWKAMAVCRMERVMQPYMEGIVA